MLSDFNFRGMNLSTIEVCSMRLVGLGRWHCANWVVSSVCPFLRTKAQLCDISSARGCSSLFAAVICEPRMPYIP